MWREIRKMTVSCDADDCYCPNTSIHDNMSLCMIHLDYYENGYPFKLKNGDIVIDD